MTSISVTIDLRNQPSLDFTCKHIKTNSNSIRVLDLINESDQGLVISFSHTLLTTQIDLSGASPYVALQFDENFNYSGAGLSLGKAIGSFGLITQAKHVVILPFDRSLPIEKVEKLLITSNT